jgi:hypothetical protein
LFFSFNVTIRFAGAVIKTSTKIISYWRQKKELWALSKIVLEKLNRQYVEFSMFSMVMNSPRMSNFVNLLL